MRIILSTVVPQDTAQKVYSCAKKVGMTPSFLIRVIIESLSETEILRLCGKDLEKDQIVNLILKKGESSNVDN